MSGAPVSILIPAFNELNYCVQCVHTLRANTTPGYKLILVDNGSTDGVGEFFDRVDGATVVHTGRNLGFAGGVNAGLAQAEGHVVLLNSDTLLPPGWLERLCAPLGEDPRIGLVGPRSNCCSGSQEVAGLHFDDADAMYAYAAKRAADHAGQRREVARLVGFCLLIRDRALEEIGTLDEAYGIGNYEDDDYCLRAQRAGWRLCVAEDAFVFHYGSRTFVGMGLTGDAYTKLMEENAAHFAAKLQPRPEERLDQIVQARGLGEQATRAYEAGDAEAACELLARALRLAPLDAQLHNDLGVVLWQLGEPERARRQFERALELDPGYLEARENLADITPAP